MSNAEIWCYTGQPGVRSIRRKWRDSPYSIGVKASRLPFLFFPPSDFVLPFACLRSHPVSKAPIGVIIAKANVTRVPLAVTPHPYLSPKPHQQRWSSQMHPKWSLTKKSLSSRSIRDLRIKSLTLTPVPNFPMRLQIGRNCYGYHAPPRFLLFCSIWPLWFTQPSSSALRSTWQHNG